MDDEAAVESTDSDVDFEAQAAAFAQKLVESAEAKKKALKDEVTAAGIVFVPPKAKARRVTKTGVVTIDFTSEMMVPDNGELDSISNTAELRCLSEDVT